jgi:PEP-CTERM motif-containing protein
MSGFCTIPSGLGRLSLDSVARPLTGAGLAFRLLTAGLVLCVCAATRDAAAVGITVPLGITFDAGATGSFGTVHIEEIAGGDLGFTITLGPDLGPNADLHAFFFNLPAGLDAGLALSGSLCGGASCATPFAVEAGKPVQGGAGSDFDFRVSFGNGAGAKGNGTLAVASFVLGADADLALADVFAEPSATSDGIETFLAAHVQSTGTGEGSETVGVPIPEPDTALLFLVGLSGIAFAGRRPRPQPAPRAEFCAGVATRPGRPDHFSGGKPSRGQAARYQWFSMGRKVQHEA